ncbi:MAG: ABC transporter permease [Alphaproteobacteria bacterium]|jgi:peptide/nickel transport system permease protein|nr:ABC transporter permease [Alphaproteobacteria bacterium]
MLWFTVRRSLLMLLMLVGLLAITFTISHIAPGDPAALSAGPDASAEMIERIRTEYGLDKPLPYQFFIYLKALLGGDWGKSIHTTHAVWDDLVDFFPATFELVVFSILISVVIGVPLGVIAAVHQNSMLDHGIRTVTVAGVAMPMFWLGLMAQLFFALQLGWFPLGGKLDMMTDPPDPITHLILVDSLLRGEFGTFGEALYHIVLPAVALSFPALASIIRVNRAEMLETLNQDYIINARAQGLSTFRIVALYALKNAMLPTMAMIGLRFGWMLGGTVLVETVFDWPGIGLYAVESAINSDFEPIMGATIVLGFFFMMANFLIDIIYGTLDPRVRDQI